MSILIIGVGNVGAGIADKINEMKMPGVNCSVVLDCVASDAYPTITKGVDICDYDPINPGGEIEIAKRLAQDNVEMIKQLIVAGTSEDWSKEEA
ncbi:MAG: hypothetical protein AUK44_00520 [Porphyromonadaceae bacterium CG2_30_38_12]|nr:MAG: hypothetical protein AUK44_00520 [Porphyromonadaceae bacterium CG2_30_38_12]